MKKFLTTGQCATLCCVSPRTVTMWFDSGRLKGFRIPGSQDRRIPKENLAEFMAQHGMPVPKELTDEQIVSDRLKERPHE